jgi:hypothetical protein
MITRKEFLTNTTKSVVAVSVGAVAGSAISASGGQPRQLPISAGAAAIPAWPWPYKKLDREDVRKRAHKFYYDGGCCYGAFNGLLAALVDAVGEPFTLMPPQMMFYGGGGGAGWGTLCGALNGAAALINLVVDRTNANAIISELFGWYTEVQFPSDISNDYAVQHAFLVNRNDKPLLQTVSTSTLCHASVSTWCTDAGVKASAPERAERCARLTGDVAARAVELLNNFVDGQFRPVFVPSKSVTGCMSCHSSAIGNVQSGVKMECQQCHEEDWDHLY